MMAALTPPDDARLMSWENFRASFLDEGIAVDIPLAGDPAVVIYAESARGAIGLRTPLPVGEAPPDSNVESIDVRAQGGELRIQTSEPELFRPFFAFLLDVGNRVQLDGQQPVAAFNAALASWRRMLAGGNVLSDDFQAGLAGELWVLDRLMRGSDPTAVDAWTGPDRDAHDFRLATTELEVKTTSGEHRRHTINRLDQLEPSSGLALHLVSIQVEGAGLADGWSLGDQVDAIRKLVTGHPAAKAFEQKLGDWGWSDRERVHYPRRRRLRTPARLVPVDDECPRLVSGILEPALGSLVHRIDQVTYRLDVESLGVEDGEPNFEAILPTPA